MIDIVLLFLIIIGLIILISFVPFKLWLDARYAGVAIDIFDLVGMRIRRVPPKLIVQAQMSAIKAGLNISTSDLETHYLAGGNVLQVVDALILADKAGIPMEFKTAAAIDLAGKNVLEVVQMQVKNEGEQIQT